MSSTDSQPENQSPLTSGERFFASYAILGTPEDIETRARALCVEQTIEFPPQFVKDPRILDEVVGRVEDLRLDEDGVGLARISFPVEATSGELTQLLNVLMGNISLQPGIRLVDVELCDSLIRRFPGPQFGVQGWRTRLGVHHRPLICTAVKPMGLSARELGDLAYRFARGGVDLIKDDHGLTDQSFASFEERVGRCVDGIERANQETGGHSGFIANVTAPVSQMHHRVQRARELGAKALMVAPGIVGFDALGWVATQSGAGLPVMSHPALLGSHVVHPSHGISHEVLFGLLNRLAGADAAVFPSFGGRFAFSQQACRAVVSGCTRVFHGLNPCFPAPGGGIRVDGLSDTLDFYGPDTLLLIGGDLHSRGEDLSATCRSVMEGLGH